MTVVNQANLFIRAAEIFAKKGFTDKEYELISKTLNDIVKKDVKQNSYTKFVEINKEISTLLGYDDELISKKEIEKVLF